MPVSEFVGFKVYIDLAPEMKTLSRTVARWMRAALLKGVRYWHRVFLEQHFKKTAYFRYSEVYKRRKGGWVTDKNTGERVKADRRPLYHDGYAMADALSSPLWDAPRWTGFTATQFRATVRFSVPYYVWGISQWGYEPRKELTYVNRQEQRKLWKVVRDEFNRQMSQAHGNARKSAPFFGEEPSILQPAAQGIAA